MLNPTQIEEIYKQFTGTLPDCAHDGIIPIDLNFLHDLGILDHLHEEQDEPEDITQYFHVMESSEKVTLFNEQFLIWIVPRSEQNSAATTVLIALTPHDKPHLEIVFTTNGVYNTPRFVLKILQHFLADMLETEETLISYEKNA